MKNILWIFISGFFLLACSNTEDSKEKAPKIDEPIFEAVETIGLNESGNQISSPDEIELDNGGKWLVNEEMKPFVLEGEKILKDFINDNSTDYASLAEKLEESNNRLIKSCTMTGKSHDELHKWLHPHLEVVKELKEVTDEKDGEVILKQLKDSYLVYHQHFQ